MRSWDEVARAIAEATGTPFVVASHEPAGGGCINEAYVLRGRGAAWFVKLNDPGRLAMFEAEAAGLAEIARTGTVRVPRPVCTGADAEASWLVLEHIAMGPPRPGSARELGRRLALMHRVEAASYGWERDNTIGATPQINARSSDWVAFWREHRLGYQLRLAAGNGYGGALQRLGERLMERLPALLAGHTPPSSLLHGDLWSGNAAFDSRGEPVVFDPAVYYGDREADLAMTELFGGFSPEFHAGYRDAYPLAPGYALRKDLYNLYHVLNHLNLFGGGYGAQAQRLMERLLAAVGP